MFLLHQSFSCKTASLPKLAHLILLTCAIRCSEQKKSAVTYEGKAVLLHKNSGIMHFRRHDVGWTAYVTVKNVGPAPLHVFGRLIECCESLGCEAKDCTSMRMLGGSAGMVQPDAWKNITFVYPNMYLYNRRGDCSVEVWYKDAYNKTDFINVHISFDTYVQGGVLPEPMRSITWVSQLGNLMMQCDSPDEDPLDHCRPVDCHKKYNGVKNYYNPNRKVCTCVPTCYADPRKELPDVAYVPTCNDCRDLDVPIAEEEIGALLREGSYQRVKRGEEESCGAAQILGNKEYINIRCHHGEFNNLTKLCDCEDGWTSAPIPEDIYLPSTLLRHFCTIRKHPTDMINFFPITNAMGMVSNLTAYLSVLISSAVIATLLVALVCCMPIGRYSDAKEGRTEDTRNSERKSTSRKSSSRETSSRQSDVGGKPSRLSKSDGGGKPSRLSKSDGGGKPSRLSKSDGGGGKGGEETVMRLYCKSSSDEDTPDDHSTYKDRSGAFEGDGRPRARAPYESSSLDSSFRRLGSFKRFRTFRKRTSKVLGKACFRRASDFKKPTRDDSMHRLMLDSCSEDSLISSIPTHLHSSSKEAGIGRNAGRTHKPILRKINEKIKFPYNKTQRTERSTCRDVSHRNNHKVVIDFSGSTTVDFDGDEIDSSRKPKEPVDFVHPAGNIPQQIFPIYQLSETIGQNLCYHRIPTESAIYQTVTEQENIGAENYPRAESNTQRSHHCQYEFISKKDKSIEIDRVQQHSEEKNRNADGRLTAMGSKPKYHADTDSPSTDNSSAVTVIPKSSSGEDTTTSEDGKPHTLNPSINNDGNKSEAIVKSQMVGSLVGATNKPKLNSGIPTQSIPRAGNHETPPKFEKPESIVAFCYESTPTGGNHEVCVDYTSSSKVSSSPIWKPTPGGNNSSEYAVTGRTLFLDVDYELKSTESRSSPGVDDVSRDESKAEAMPNDHSSWNEMENVCSGSTRTNGVPDHGQGSRSTKGRPTNSGQTKLKADASNAINENEEKAISGTNNAEGRENNVISKVSYQLGGSTALHSTRDARSANFENESKSYAGNAAEDGKGQGACIRHNHPQPIATGMKTNRDVGIQKGSKGIYSTAAVNPDQLYEPKSVGNTSNIDHEKHICWTNPTDDVNKKSKTRTKQNKFNDNKPEKCAHASGKIKCVTFNLENDNSHSESKLNVQRQQNTKLSNLMLKDFVSSENDSLEQRYTISEEKATGTISSEDEKTDLNPVEVWDKTNKSNIPVLKITKRNEKESVKCSEVSKQKGNSSIKKTAKQNEEGIDCPSSSSENAEHILKVKKEPTLSSKEGDTETRFKKIRTSLIKNFPKKNRKETAEPKQGKTVKDGSVTKRIIDACAQEDLSRFLKHVPQESQWKTTAAVVKQAFSRKPTFERWSGAFGANGLQAEVGAMRKQYRTLRSYERLISGSAKLLGETDAPEGLSSERTDCLVVFGRSAGELKRYHAVVESFRRLYESLGPEAALAHELEPGAPVDPRAFPARGLLRLEGLPQARQLVAALLHHRHYTHMLLAAGEPPALDALESYAAAFSSRRMRKSLIIRKIPPGDNLYEFVVKNFLHLPSNIRKTTISTKIPFIYILWRSLLYLKDDQIDQYSFARAMNFVSTIFYLNIFSTAREAYSNIKKVKEIYSDFMSLQKNEKRLQVPFKVIERIVRNLSTMKRREMIVRLVNQQITNINYSLDLHRKKPKINSVVNQFKRDLDNSVARYYETLHEFDYC